MTESQPSMEGSPVVAPPAEPTAAAKAAELEKAAPGLRSRRWIIPAALAAGVFLAAALFFYGRQEPSPAVASEVSPVAHPLLAEAKDYYQQKNYKRAMVSAKELLSLQPEQVEAILLVGNILLAEERPREAAQAAQEALAIDPAMAEPHAMLGQVHLLTGQWSEALDASRRALILDPGLGLPYRVIGEVYLRQNRVPDSIAVFKEALKLLPPTVDLMQKLGGAYIREGDFAAAEDLLTQALKLDANDAGVHFNLARVYVETGDGMRAIHHMETAERLYSEAENTFWSAKARHNKLTIARKFHMTPESLSP